MKKSILAFTCLWSLSGSAATLSLSGNYRFGSNLFSNLDLEPGVRAGMGNTSTFWENRFLVKPDILIDDRFTLKSEVSLLNLNSGTYSVPGEFGTPLDYSRSLSDNSQVIDLRRAYLEWASDWGLLRVGRQPKTWGLGLLFDAGTDPLQDFATTVDRVGFQALIGNLGFNVGFEKTREGSLHFDGDDMESYELSLDYTNPESLLEVGLLYIRNIRLGFPLKNSSHDFSFYSTRRWGNFQIGGEFVSIGEDDKKSQLGALAQIDFTPGSWNLALDFGFASASAEGNFAFHPNQQPFMILFRQNIGSAADVGSVRGGPSGNTAVGSAVVSSGGAGATFVKGRIGYGFDKDKLILGSDFGFARLARNTTGSSKNLGFEVDFHLKQQWYKNFYLTYALGALIPGAAFGPDVKLAWGLQLRGVLTF